MISRLPGVKLPKLASREFRLAFAEPGMFGTLRRAIAIGWPWNRSAGASAMRLRAELAEAASGQDAAIFFANEQVKHRRIRVQIAFIGALALAGFAFIGLRSTNPVEQFNNAKINNLLLKGVHCGVPQSLK